MDHLQQFTCVSSIPLTSSQFPTPSTKPLPRRKTRSFPSSPIHCPRGKLTELAFPDQVTLHMSFPGNTSPTCASTVHSRAVDQEIPHSSKSSAPGPTGLRCAHFHQQRTYRISHSLHALFQLIISRKVPLPFLQLMVSGSATCLWNSNNKIRPIAVQQTTRLLSKLSCQLTL
jgi:hypothetical protein